MSKLTGIELLRYAVRMLNRCNESVNQRFTAPQLIRIAEGVQRSEWDFYPDEWTDQQLQECAQFGITPTWEDKNNEVVPKYKQTGENVYKIAGEYVATFEVKVVANSLQEAIDWSEGDMPTPKDTEYLDDSFRINEEVTTELNPTQVGESEES